MDPQTTVSHTQRTPRGRQYSRNKVTTTTTEKPVLKWMPKRKRPKHEPTKIAATLNNSATVLPRPHISNRTRIVAQASSNRPVVVAMQLDDVSMGPEEAHFQRRHEKYVQGTAAVASSPSFVEKSNGLQQTTNTPRNNKKRKNHVHHEYTNFVTVPTTTTTTTTAATSTTTRAAGSTFSGTDETIPEPQKNVYTTTTTYPTVMTTTPAYNVPTFTSRTTIPSTTPVPESLVQTTLERDVYTTSAVPHFLPTTIPPAIEGGVVPAVPLELFELSKAQVKPLETDTPDVELFRASHRDEEEEEYRHGHADDDDEDSDLDNERRHQADEDEEDGGDEDEDDHSNDDEEEGESSLDFIAKSIVAHAKKVFSAAASTNEVDGEGVHGEEEEVQQSAASSSTTYNVKSHRGVVMADDDDD